MQKINLSKRLVPAYVFNETEKAIIKEKFNYILTPVVIGGKTIHCLEFNEDVLDVLDALDSYTLFEAEMSDSEKRGLATRMSTICFQCIRELTYINGSSLAELGKGLRAVGRCVALACVAGIAVLSLDQARRLIPLVRAI